MKVLITGANGFVGLNLVAHLGERADVEVLTYTRADSLESLPERVAQADFIFHLAGVNRPQDPREFRTGNADLTSALCDAVSGCGRQIPVLYTSSTQAELENPYGDSKRGAEEALLRCIPSTAFRFTCSAYPMCLVNGHGRITTRPLRLSVTTFPGICRSVSTTHSR